MAESRNDIPTEIWVALCVPGADGKLEVLFSDANRQAVLDHVNEALGDEITAQFGPFKVVRFIHSEKKPRAGFYVATFRHPWQGHVLWWGPNNAGYTPDLEQAGIYTEGDFGEDIRVPVEFVDKLRVRRVVDPGDSLNTCFWDAERLRAAIAAFSTNRQGGAHG